MVAAPARRRSQPTEVPIFKEALMIKQPENHLTTGKVAVILGGTSGSIAITEHCIV
jgi:hypothetical protein